MTDFEAIDALLADARQEVSLPPVDVRRALREGLNLSRPQVAEVLGVSPSTVGGWESGRDPGGAVREKYAYFLEGARAKLERQAAAEAHAQVEAAAEAHAQVEASAEAHAQVEASAEAEQGADGRPTAPDGQGAADPGREPEPWPAPAPHPHSDAVLDADDVEALKTPRPCVLCGTPARHQVAGFPQHLDPSDCAADDQRQPTENRNEPVNTARAATGPTSRPRVKVVPVGRRVQAAAELPDLIGEAVAAALAQHEGDVDAASATLLKRAIPGAMALLDETRKGGRYDIVAHPWIPEILRKQTARGADRIWEARPKWVRPELPAGRHEVTALDVNGAYLSALKTHLPIGQLEHSTDPVHDRRRAGVHLITPPAWEHEAVLPNPLGDRDEPGPLWVTEPTLRLLLRLSSPKYGLCDVPAIHESFTSGATEGLLEKFRVALKDAREKAIAENDEVTLEYVKAMYSKFVATMGESNYNRELYRPDWMHLIRSQAFSNLWMKAYKAYDEGLTVVRAMGTDEFHVIGDWRAVFPEGRGVTEVKVKDTYTVGRDELDRTL